MYICQFVDITITEGNHIITTYNVYLTFITYFSIVMKKLSTGLELLVDNLGVVNEP